MSETLPTHTAEEHPSLTQRVTDQIIQLILQKGLQAGDKLPNEYELAQLLSVGRSTVREAIKALTARHVLEIRRGAGTFIAPRPGVADDPLGLQFIPDQRKMAGDLLTVRSIIEPTIAGFAAQHATPEQVAQLEALCVEMEQLGNEASLHLEKDLLFHQKIAEFSGNCVVSNLMPIINETIVLFLNLNVQASGLGVLQDTNRSHREVLEAIAAHDPFAARDAMLVHIARNRRNLDRS
ncbi:MAG: FadR/GntR family transcriptional regulator [Eubacteriales bacterium]|jgi:GntR family transcriptional repressor for pyruvate dehydrogenase complex